MRRVILSVFTLLSSVAIVHAQSIGPATFNSTGGTYDAANSYFRLDWSVGEMALVNQMQSSGGSNIFILTNGLLQPYINTPGTFDNSSTFTADEIKVFPNPAVKYVEINLRTKEKGTFYLSLYNSIGQRVYFTTFNTFGLDRIEKINTDKLAAGTYLLYIDMHADPGSTSKKRAYTIFKAR